MHIVESCTSVDTCHPYVIHTDTIHPAIAIIGKIEGRRPVPGWLVCRPAVVLVPVVMLILLTAWPMSPTTANAQESRWLNAGSLQNWYSAIGNEREHGMVAQQQFGLRWPANLEHQDAQHSKAFWIGTRNFDDGENEPFDFKVIHAGPRVLGDQSFFPREFALHSRYEAPEVLVNDRHSVRGNVDPQIDVVDPGLPSDRMIRNTVETALGITFTRDIHQFSQQFHDNYHILEYTFVNETGNYRDIPEQTLDSVYFYFQFRYAPVNKSRYMVANHTGWGRNTMNDRWGDGLQGQSVGEPFSDDGPPMRAAYAWHGHEPSREIDYNNIGAPQIQPNTSRGLMTPADTLGHLLAHHFVGHATLHADTSPDDPSDDLQQPRTRGHVNSDDDLKAGNDPFNRVRMQREYSLMARGIMPRHAYQVHQATEFMDFADQTHDPRLGTSGGMSAMKAYGPYTLEPGDTIRIVWAEGVAGLSREMAEIVGERFKAHYEGRTDDARGPLADGTTDEMTTRAKNEWVMTGRDSLLQTLERAMANYRIGYNIPHPPPPPSRFELASLPGAIELNWEFSGDENQMSGFAIYRGSDSFEAHHERIALVDPSERTYIDHQIGQGESYFYYITSVGLEDRIKDVGRTPDGILLSSRYYTQTWDPISPLTDTGAGEDDGSVPYVLDLAQNYPNPFNPATRITFELPRQAQVRLTVYDIQGRRISELAKDVYGSGRHDVTFDAAGLASGVYIYRLQAGDRQITRKMMLMR